jgi:DNA-binding NarL/FixJ family response regulator
MSEKIKVVITDDNDQVRHGLSMLLSASEDFAVVGQAANGRQALEVCQRASPDVVIMDVGMPVMDGIEACQQIKRKYSNIKVIMLTSHEGSMDVLASLAAGADGYYLKDSDFDRLVIAIKSVSAGDLWLDSQIATAVKRLVNEKKGSQTVADKGSFQPLSPREQQVLNLIVEGLSNSEIAERLEITVETVKTHVRSLMTKLAVSGRTQMAVKALRSGLI